MSGAWNNSSFQQAPPPGQVKLFDPTQFQTPLSTPSSGAIAGQVAFSQPAQSAYNSWNSWGSWDWNPDSAGSGQGVAASSARGVGDQQQLYSGHDSQGHIPQYSQAWNQSWDGAGTHQQTDWGSTGQQQQLDWGGADQQLQQSDRGMSGHQTSDQQYPAYDQPAAMNGPSSTQQHRNFQGYQQTPGEAVDQSHFMSPQFYNDQFYNQQQPQQHFPYQQQQQEQSYPPLEQGQSSQSQQQEGENVPGFYQQEQNVPPRSQLEQSFLPQEHPQMNLPSSQQQHEQSFPPQQHMQPYSEEPVLSSAPQPHEEASLPQQNSLDQAQQHQQFQQGAQVDQGQQLQQQQSPQQEYYDQPYDASSWTPASSSSGLWGNSDLQAAEVVAQTNSSQDDTADSGLVEEQSAAPFQQAPVLVEDTGEAPPQQRDPVLDAFDENDNDGTVSGFFGRDDDGDIPTESPRLGRWGDSVNQLPVQQPSFHRTHSDISNASLMTLNFPQSEGDEEDGDPLHHVQELVQRMEATQLAREAEGSQSTAEVSHSQLPGESGDSGMTIGLPEDFNSRNLSGSGSGDQVEPQGQIRGDYSGFGGGASDFNTSNQLEHANLPLDTNLRPASPDGEDQPGSGGSGASGGSSGLADWEIVPSQISSGRSHSGNSSLDNGVSGTGGGFFTDRPDGGMASSNNSAAVPSVSDFTIRGSGDSSQSVIPPVPNTSLPLDVGKHPTPPNQSMVGQGDGHSDNHNVASQHQSGDTQPMTSDPPLPPMLSVPPISLPPQTSDTSGNPFRRGGNKSPRHASLAQPTSLVSAMPPPPVPAPSTSQQQQKSIAGDNKEQGLTALPTRPKAPLVSSEDGIPARRRETDQLAKQQDRGAGKKSGHDSASSQDRPRHHSAFHPVNRPRLTTMSPATTLWDQEEAPSTNILLAPAMPLIIPALNPYSTSAAATATSENDSRSSTANRHGGTVPVDTPRSREKVGNESKGDSRRGGSDRREEDPNRSFDSLDEINSESRGLKDRSYREQRERDERYRPETDRDRPSSRVDRPQSRSGGQYHYDRDRPSSRAEGYGRDDPYRRNRAYYRDYGDISYDERYDRPRSRQDELRGSRPTSRTGQQEMDRPRSRANYDRDREYYGRGDRHRGQLVVIYFLFAVQ
ncbi:transport protein Sec16A [Elysia marginata]|uniref:Transport protein Sec16A n=1 Tax=Elysia marginata TaxID=1093978 RepID=A0AAV4ESN0_9GAST|nr:transport protein Sec16A [Elysia marginata]